MWPFLYYLDADFFKTNIYLGSILEEAALFTKLAVLWRFWNNSSSFGQIFDHFQGRFF